MKPMIKFFAACTRALKHNGALDDEEVENCTTVVEANDLLTEKGEEANALYEEEGHGWMKGIEGWTQMGDDEVYWVTGTHRMEVLIRNDKAFIRFSSGEKNDEGDNEVCRLKISESFEITVISRTSSLHLERIDRVYLLEAIYHRLGIALDVQEFFFPSR